MDGYEEAENVTTISARGDAESAGGRLDERARDGLVCRRKRTLRV